MKDQRLHNSSPKTTKATLGGLELRCPPLPQTLLDATKLIDEPEQLEVGPVTEMVQRDPSVVAKLLHIVNSAYYGLRRTINSVERTVVMLGPVAVTGIVVGMMNYVISDPSSRYLSGQRDPATIRVHPSDPCSSVCYLKKAQCEFINCRVSLTGKVSR